MVDIEEKKTIPKGNIKPAYHVIPAGARAYGGIYGRRIKEVETIL